MGYLEIIYAHWLVILAMLYIAYGLIFLIFKKSLLADGGKILKIHAVFLMLVIISFYFFIPVPESIQNRLVGDILQIKNNNKNVSFFYTTLTLSDVCDSKYISGFDFFKTKESYIRDFDIVLDEQKMVNLGGINQNEIKNTKGLCDLKGEL